ncbi:hypothetical protein GINT2_001733 [Glugoides intestinalis]
MSTSTSLELKIDRTVQCLKRNKKDILNRVPRIPEIPECFFLKDLVAAYEKYSWDKVESLFFFMNYSKMENSPFKFIPSLGGQPLCEYSILHEKCFAVPLWKIKKVMERIISRAPKTQFSICSSSNSNSPSSADAILKLADPPTAKYDDFSSSDDFLEPSPAFISPLAPFPTPAPKKKEDFKASIIEAFSMRPILPLETFQAAYCFSNGKAIDYKTAPCSIKNHSHVSLSKYLRCFPDILGFIQLSKLYLICKTPHIVDISRKRLASYRRPLDDQLAAYCVEALSVNLFATRVSIFLTDFLELFRIIYGTPFSSIWGEISPQVLLGNLRSPNVLLSVRDGAYTLVLCPTGNTAFVEWGSIELHKKIEAIERSFLEAPNTGTSPLICGIKSIDVFHSCGVSPAILKKMEGLLAISDLNIPRRIQEKSGVSKSRDGILKWYVDPSVNFDDRRPFFSSEERSINLPNDI